MTDSVVITQHRDPIFEIIINRPDERNAMNWAVMQGLEAAIDEAEQLFNQQTARAIIIRAEGRVFSSGIDLTEFTESSAQFGENWHRNLYPVTAAYQQVFNKIERCSLPVICLMHGYAIGLSVEMALACDFRIAAERTRLSLPETRLGIIPDVGGTVRLTKLIGPSRAKDLILTGRNLDIKVAEQWGLVNEVVPRANLLSRGEEFAAEIALSAPLAVSYAKRVVNDVMDYQAGLNLEAWAQAQLMRTEDFVNGVQAMLNKEYPVDWQGK